MEELDAFRARARAFAQELAPLTSRPLDLHLDDELELAEVARDRTVQRMFFDAGLAGIVVPKEYGGQGLTPAHQRVLNEELAGHEYPIRLQAPGMTPCLAVLVEFGTEAQKRQHIPAILKGEEIWMQFLSEPSSGSDAAAAQLTATRDGDDWLLNGSKIWTTGAWWADWGLILTRTNWDVPKHQGLTVFLAPIDAPGIELHRIEMLNGNREFCQEFFTDVRVPDSDRVGEVHEAWNSVGRRWMFHEKMLWNSPYVTLPAGTTRGGESRAGILDIARAAGRLDDTAGREAIGEIFMLNSVGEALKRRVGRGIATGLVSDQSAAIARLYGGEMVARSKTILFDLAGAAAVGSTADDGALHHRGVEFLMRQAGSIGGGTTEMARNVISERVLGMPREAAADKGVAFRDVPRGGRR